MKSSVKQHLQEFHEKSAAHHVAKAVAHGVSAECFGKLAECENCDDDQREHFGKVAEMEQKQSDEHTQMGNYHTKCAKALAESDASKVDAAPTMAKSDVVVTGGNSENVIPVGGWPSELQQIFE